MFPRYSDLLDENSGISIPIMYLNPL